MSIKKALLAAMAVLTACSISPADASPSETTTGSKSMFTPKEHVRGEDQTFLTLPEWFLVHSPEEYATYLKSNRPSKFPFFGHISQFWQTYYQVYKETNGKYPFNAGYHVMVMTIGISTTVEYAFKGAYESIFGAITENSGLNYRTAEDEYAAKIAQNYVDFIKVDPWYKFDFVSALKGLWNNVPTDGEHKIRKWERRYALTTEYLIKAGYGWVIKKATQASFDAPIPKTAVVVEIGDPDKLKSIPGITNIKKTEEGSYFALLPRYGGFTPASQAAAIAGAKFKEIAGNTHFIMISLLMPKSLDKYAIDGSVKLVQPILTQPNRQRVVYLVDIEKLDVALKKAKSMKMDIEHIYDF
jgi:hypothetical protein